MSLRPFSDPGRPTGLGNVDCQQYILAKQGLELVGLGIRLASTGCYTRPYAGFGFRRVTGTSMELKTVLKLQQQLVMTPQLQQAIRLLQLSRMELVDEVRARIPCFRVREEAAAS